MRVVGPFHLKFFIGFLAFALAYALLIHVLTAGLGFFDPGDDEVLSLNESEVIEWKDRELRRASLPEAAVSEILPNCGLLASCPDNSFPVHIYTGQDKDDQPRLCVNGKYFKGIRRGINIALVDPKRLQVVSLVNFDVYNNNNGTLEKWLEDFLVDDDLIIAFTFDEASRELSHRAKSLFYHLGSGKIQDLMFRCQWYLITQKGIEGFSPFEYISYSQKNLWAPVINKRMCVPRKIEPSVISPDPYLRHNKEREALCARSKQLQCEYFCNSLSRHEPYFPSLLTNRTLIGNIAFSVPILIIAGESMSALVLTLETVIYQPGIHPASVYILHTTQQQEVTALGKIFGFATISINQTVLNHPNSKIFYGVQYLEGLFMAKKYVIVIEEDLILSPDFLFYMAQMAPVMDQDKSILAVSAWNPYGYVGVSGNIHAAYRVNNFPGLGFMMPFAVFVEEVESKFAMCCKEPIYKGWPSVLQNYKGRHIIIPDVSRVLKRPKEQYKRRRDSQFEVFTRSRVTNTNMNAWIERPQDLLHDRYFQRMANLIQSSITFYLTDGDIKLCENGSNIAVKIMLSELKNKVFSAYIKEDSCETKDKMITYMKCFGIYHPEGVEVYNLYEGVLRFTVNTNTVLLIDMKSTFAKNRSRIQEMSRTI